MNYSVNWLLEQTQTDFLFFWGHQLPPQGISKACFSQWAPFSFTENGIEYKTAEHYMMAKKAALFGDQKIVELVLKKEHPKDVKDLGRQVQHFDPQLWDQHKYNIVKQGNWLKFSQNETLKQFLLQTKTKVIVEASPVDAIWGIGLAEDHANATNPALWKGENLLGFALMEVRDQLQEKTH